MRQYTQTNQQFTVSYFSHLLAKKNISPNMVSLDRGHLETWRLAQMYSPKSVGTNDEEGEFHRMIKPRMVNNAVVSAVVAFGNGLQLTFSNGHDGFRRGDVLYSDSMAYCRVLDNPGTGIYVVESQFEPDTLSASTDFQIGEKVYLSHDRSGNKWSDAKSYLHTKRDKQTDYVEFQRDACGRPRRDKVKHFIGGTTGIVYTYSDDEVDMVDRQMKAYTKKFWLSEPGKKTSSYQGAINGTRGVRKSIKTDGIANMTSNSQITRAILEDMVLTVAGVRGGAYNKEVTIHPGRRAHQRISSFYPEQLAFSGSRLVNGYQEINLDVRSFIIAGVKTNIVPLSWLNDDQEVPDWFKDSIYIMDMSSLPSANNMGPESPLLRIHWATDPSQPEENIYKIRPGLTANQDDNYTGSVTIGGVAVTTSSLDGYHVDYAMDNGISYLADASGLFEFPH